MKINRVVRSNIITIIVMERTYKLIPPLTIPPSVNEIAIIDIAIPATERRIRVPFRMLSLSSGKENNDFVFQIKTKRYKICANKRKIAQKR